MSDQTDVTPEKDEGAEQDYSLDYAIVEGVIASLDMGDSATARELIKPLHNADFADLLEQVSPTDRQRIIEALGSDLDGEALPELDESVRDEILDYVEPEVLAEAVKDLDSDDLVYLVEDMEAAEQAKVLDALDDDDRVIVEQPLTYPEESAGRMMQRELVKAPPFWTVGQTIDYMRAADDLPEQFLSLIHI